MEWYEELYFDENPFTTNPKSFADKLVGRSDVIDELFYRIRAGSMVFIEGDEGSGKTALLWNVIRRFRGRGKVIYVDCSEIEDVNIEELLDKRQGVFARLFRDKPKNMILLLDNVKKLSQTNSERVKYYFDQGYIKSVVFTGEDYLSVNFSQSLRDRIGSRIIELEPIDAYQAIALVRNRIDNLEMVEDNQIKEIFKKSGNPKEFLNNCDKVFRHAMENNNDKITEDDLKVVEG